MSESGDFEAHSRSRSGSPDIPIQDHPSIAFLVMFQSRFYSLFEGVPRLGPEELALGLQTPDTLSRPVEEFMCRIMTLVLNRKKKPIEPGKYGRPLEELQPLVASLGVGPHWPGVRFRNKNCVNELGWLDRLEVLRTLAVWALSCSEFVRQIVANARASQAKTATLDAFLGGDHDPEQGLEGRELEPLGRDARQNCYYLIQGYGNTSFGLYCGSDQFAPTQVWTCLASSAHELQRFLGDSTTPLSLDSSKQAQKLRKRLQSVVGTLADAETRRIRDAQRSQRASHLRQQAEQLREAAKRGEGMYHGRTRGRRINYDVDAYDDDVQDQTYELEDDDDEYGHAGRSSAQGTRRSARIKGGPVEYAMLEHPEELGTKLEAARQSPSQSLLVTLNYGVKSEIGESGDAGADEQDGENGDTVMAGVDEPKYPGIVEPKYPGSVEPKYPGIGEPKYPGIVEPKYPGIVEPKYPGIVEPKPSEPKYPGIVEQKPSEPKYPGVLSKPTTKASSGLSVQSLIN